MNHINKILVAGILGVVLYGAYAMMTGGAGPADEALSDDPWDGGPSLELQAGAEEGGSPEDGAAGRRDSSGGRSSYGGSDPIPLVESPASDEAAATAGAGGSPPFVAPDFGGQPDRRGDVFQTGHERATSQHGFNDPNLEPASSIPPAPVGERTQGSPAGSFAADLSQAKRLWAEGQLAEAHLVLSPWYGATGLAAEEEGELIELLDRLAGAVVYSREHLLERPYQVQPGDDLEQIAQTYDVPWQLLAKINGVEHPQSLRDGDQLKVIRGPFDAIVELDRFQLTLMVGGRYAGRFPIGIGQDQSAAAGEYQVLDKVVNPTYYGTDRVVDADDPANPLGEYWIDLGNQLGIHGTSDPQTVGGAGSRGVIGLTERDIQDVFDILSVGSRVLIRR